MGSLGFPSIKRTRGDARNEEPSFHLMERKGKERRLGRRTEACEVRSNHAVDMRPHDALGRRKVSIASLSLVCLPTFERPAVAVFLPSYEETIDGRMREEDFVLSDEAASYVRGVVPESYKKDVEEFRLRNEDLEARKVGREDLKALAANTAALTTDVSTVSTAVLATNAATTAILSAAENSFSACLSEAVTIPIDTAKVRLQLQGRPSYVEGVVTRIQVKKASSPEEEVKYKGTIQTILTIAREEGFLSLFSGLDAGLQHQISYGGLRLALYNHLKTALNSMSSSGTSALALNVLAGLVSGVVAVLATNPVEVVKVRMQGTSNFGTGPWWKPYMDIVKKEGARGLWVGVTPNLARNSIMNAAELAAFDSIHHHLDLLPLLSDSSSTLLAGMGAGILAAFVGSPADVLRSQVMSESSSGSESSLIASAKRILEEEGIGGLYRGVGPLAVRLAAFDMVLFFSLEKVRHLLEFLADAPPM